MTRTRPSDDRRDGLPAVSRRTALRAAGAAAVGAVTALAGCSTGEAESDATPTDVGTGSTGGSNGTQTAASTEATQTESAGIESTETESTETESTETETADEEWESWFAPTDNYDGFADHTGESEVTVMVGADGIEGPHAYEPTAIRVSPGTTVVWEWTGAGGTHDVIAEDDSFESELVADEGHTFEQTFEETGTTKYFCTPHRAMGMRGGIIVEE
ncbi:halocyanin domain-containing protein [Haloprofundus salinisoli]|uniref:halocyanin domain-containing protein n=1 Tax=Haloprofundus salinisoli TaxID=2876193 RepID=UPI001CCC3C52|nr:halocyanin domain-containing protein [Haloprofundus salinisoli]